MRECVYCKRHLVVCGSRSAWVAAEGSAAADNVIWTEFCDRSPYPGSPHKPT